MRIGVVGINHRLADLKLREQLAKICQKRFGSANSVHGDHHFVLLSTCNRTEVYFCSEDLAETHTYLLSILRGEVEEDFDQKLYSYFGSDCFCHLTRVASGLDSAIVAETEIQGQVKTAYETAAEFHRLPSEIHYLFQKALGISKKIRSDLQLGRGMPNLEHAIFNIGKHFFKHTSTPSILFVGASEINRKILIYLKSKGLSRLTLCNRSLSSSEFFQQKESVDILNWSDLKTWVEYDWIVFGTKAPDYLIRREEALPSYLTPKLVMDLSVPRNVDPKLGKDSRLTLLNIDQINRLLKIRRRGMNEALAVAESMITHLASQQVKRYQEKAATKLSLYAVSA